MPALATRDIPEDRPGWEASLDLGFTQRGERTVLTTRRHRGPLVVQRPFYPEGGPCHVYLLHPPGGVVGGDRLTISAAVGPDAHALATTPGAGKLYRSGGRPAMVGQHLTVAAGGALEWFPQETLIFDGARCRLRTRVDLAATGRFMGWEILCFGRPASGDYFREGLIDSRLQICREGRPLFIDALRIDGGAELGRPSGMRGCIVSAMFVAAGCPAEAAAGVREALSPRLEGWWGATQLDELLLVRYLGNAAAEARALFTEVWRTVRPVLHGRAACPPRIWAT